MTKEIWIIKSVSQIAGKTRVDNVFAVTSEEVAKKDVHNFNEKAAKENKIIPDYDVWYIYEKINLYD